MTTLDPGDDHAGPPDPSAPGAPAPGARPAPAGASGRPGPDDGRGWRRLVLVVAVLAAGALSVDLLGDLTQSRPDTVEPGSRSEIVLAVDTRDYSGSDLEAARNLWAACSGRIDHRLVEDPGMVAVGDDAVRFSVEPALGDNAHRKLVGCLEDTTLERVKGHVRSVEPVSP